MKVSRRTLELTRPNVRIHRYTSRILSHRTERSTTALCHCCCRAICYLVFRESRGSAVQITRRAKLQIHHRKYILVIQKERCAISTRNLFTPPLLGETVVQTAFGRSLLFEDENTVEEESLYSGFSDIRYYQIPAFIDLRECSICLQNTREIHNSFLESLSFSLLTVSSPRIYAEARKFFYVTVVSYL